MSNRANKNHRSRNQKSTKLFKIGEEILDIEHNEKKKLAIQVWSKCLEYIRTKVSAQSFITWFQPIVPIRIENNTLTIQVPSQFFYEWLEEHHIDLLRDVITQELGKNGKLSYSIIVDDKSKLTQSQNSKLKKTGKDATDNHKKEFSSIFDVEDSFLNPKYTFENFVEGDSNQLASSAAQAIAKKPGKTSFNPLLIYGRVGLGKTHLMQAIGHESKKNYSDKKVLYISSEKFTNQFIEALRHNAIQNFIASYLQIDILLIDDIQFMSGKEKTQEIFFHIFNHLHQHGKQIVITSDRAPNDLKGLQERLLSRFKWGLTADIHVPNFETRVAIIEKKLALEGVTMPDNLIKYIACSIDSNIRELEGALISLIAHASLNNTELTIDLVKKVLSNIIDNIESEVSIPYLQKIVAEHCDITVDDLKGSSRKREIVIARQIAMHLAKNYTNHSLKTIGEQFGGKHHSTVIHAMQSVEDMISIDDKIKKQLNAIVNRVNIKSV